MFEMLEEMTPKQREVAYVAGGLVVAAALAIMFYERKSAAAPATAPAPTPAPTPAQPTSSTTTTLLPNTTQQSSITNPIAIGLPVGGSMTIALPVGASWISLNVAATNGAPYMPATVSGSSPYSFTYQGNGGIATAAWTDSTGTVNTTYLSFYTVNA